MSGANEPAKKAVHKPIGELFADYLRRQMSAHAAGLELGETAGEVMLYEAAPVQATDPRLAWNEALAALAFLRPDVEQRTCQVPPDWASLLGGLAPVVALPLCVGN